jgi:acyl dehydratase
MKNNPSSVHEKKFDIYWEDFQIGQIREFGSKTVSKDEIVEFAEKFDPQRFHVNPTEAEETIFKGIIASGWHTCSLMMKMMCDEYVLRSSSLGSPGLENIKWLKPVRPGDTLRMRTTVLDSRSMESKPHIGLIHTLWECLNQKNEIVTTMDGWGMFLKRDHK